MKQTDLKTLKKDDMKTGMIVKVRNGMHYMVMRDTGIVSVRKKETDVIWHKGGFWMPLADYDDNLMKTYNIDEDDFILPGKEHDYALDREFDIMKVYAPTCATGIGDMKHYKLIFDRGEDEIV